MPVDLQPSKTAVGTVVGLEYTPTEQYVDENETTKEPEHFDLRAQKVLGSVVFHDDSVIILDLCQSEGLHDYRIFDVSRCVITFFHESGGQAEGVKNA